MKKILWIALMLAGGVLHAAEPLSRPNIIVVVADDLSRSLCTFLPEGEGRALMPTIDRLAREGAVLSNMHSPSPVCTPSRYAILTGRYPSRSQSPGFLQQMEHQGQAAVGFNTHITQEESTLQRRFQQLGYVTGAFGKNHTIEVPGFKRVPYSANLDDPGVPEQMARNQKLLKEAFIASGFTRAERLYHGNPDADGIKVLAAHNQDWITEGALSFIEDNREKPFFIYMATTIPHGPFEPARSWRGDPRITPEGFLDPEDVPQVQRPRETIDERLKAAGISTWNSGQVLWLDDAVEALVNKLEALEIADNTVIVFVSDHGTAAKGGAYDGGTRTAALIWRKGGFARTEVDAGLQLTDLAPTLLEAAGADLEMETGMDGKSFLPLLAGEKTVLHDSLYFEMGYSRALVQGGYKYLAVRYPEKVENMSLEERTRRLEESNRALAARGRPLPTEDPSAPFSHLFLIPGGHDVDQVAVKGFPAFFDRDQLYNLESDPGEQTNLFPLPAYREKGEEMQARLREILKTLPGGFGEFTSVSQ